MIKHSISIDDAIGLLNEIATVDPEAAHNLVEQRVECTERLRGHATIQVLQPDGEKPSVGLLGIINGMFGADEDGWGPICAVFEDDGKLSRFQRSPAKL